MLRKHVSVQKFEKEILETLYLVLLVCITGPLYTILIFLDSNHKMQIELKKTIHTHFWYMLLKLQCIINTFIISDLWYCYDQDSAVLI